ncbi:MAG: zinc ribbon domain-containing protein [Acidobacteriota bacterium]
MDQLDYRCPKCEGTTYEVDQFRATGGVLTKIFDVQSKIFTTVNFERCRYTEIYKADSSMLGNIFEFFTQ